MNLAAKGSISTNFQVLSATLPINYGLSLSYFYKGWCGKAYIVLHHNFHLEYRKHMPSPDESISLRRRCRTISSFLKKTYQLLKVRFLWPRMSEPGCRAMGAQRLRFHRPQRRYFLQSGAPPATSSTATTPPSSYR